MKAHLVLLLAAFGGTVHAQTVYRCEDGAASVVYRDTACPGSSQAYTPGTPASGSAPVPANAESASPGDWEIGKPSARRDRARDEAVLITVRVQARQKVLDDRNAARYAENRDRCEVALRVAEHCGKFTGRFYCGEKGFMPIAQDATVRTVALDNGSAYQMERCATLEAAKRGP